VIKGGNLMKTIRRLESEVRSYSRSFPVLFEKAKDAFLFDADGNRYIDFFAGAGTLNYGHNNDHMKKKLIEYLETDGIVHGLDMATVAKEELLLKMESIVFKPRNLDYKIQFTGPTGTNAVEAGLKLARMVKKTVKRDFIYQRLSRSHDGIDVGHGQCLLPRRGLHQPFGRFLSALRRLSGKRRQYGPVYATLS